jgi:hypothetical protein
MNSVLAYNAEQTIVFSKPNRVIDQRTNFLSNGKKLLKVSRALPFMMLRILNQNFLAHHGQENILLLSLQEAV